MKRRLARRWLLAFATYLSAGFIKAAHLKVLADRLEAVERGECRRLMVFMPPRHGKSETASRRFPAWFLGKNPTRQIIAASYNQEIASDFGRDVRNTIASKEFSRIFPSVTLREDSTAANRWHTAQGGVYIAAGVGTAITGRGADVLLIDDPVKNREEADSETIREKTWKWYTSTAYTRLMPGGSIVLVQTRWHEDDLAGRLLAEQKIGGDKWDVIDLPAISADGAALWPDRYPLKVLESYRRAIGSREFEALYQQRPSAPAGNVFKREWWKRFQNPPAFTRIVQSWDTAFKKGAENDYSVCTTWGEAADGFYLLDLWRQRVEFPELKRAVVDMAAKWKPIEVLVEDKASGQSLIQELQRDTRLSIIPVAVDKDKLARANAVTPAVESGRVFLPAEAAWVSDFVDECAGFPSAAHDDQVDSMTQALARINGAEDGILGFYRMLNEQDAARRAKEAVA